MCKEFDKPFLTYTQQIELLRSRGLEIQDEAYAKDVLEDFSYYSLVNGYKEYFQHDDRFHDGISLQDLVYLYQVDSQLNSILLRYALMIENRFKSVMTYMIGKKYGVSAEKLNVSGSYFHSYLNPKHYSTSGSYTNKKRTFLKKCNHILFNTPTNKLRSKALQHYLVSKNHVPPWILATELTFADVLNWYTILRSEDKKEICHKMLGQTDLSEEKQKDFLRQLLELTRSFRNSTAHNSKRSANITVSDFLYSQITQLLKERGYISQQQCVLSSQIEAIIGVFLILIHNEEMKQDFCDDMNRISSKFNYQFGNGNCALDVFGFPKTAIWGFGR